MLSLGTDMKETAPEHWAGAVSEICERLAGCQRTGPVNFSPGPWPGAS